MSRSGGLAALAVCFLVAGCGSSTTPTTTGTGSAAVCSDAAAVKNSLQKLGQVDVSKDTAGELRDDLSQVKNDLSNLASSAGSQWSGQIAALRSSLSAVQTAVQNLAGGSGTTSAVTAALGGVSSAATDLLSKTTAHCPQ